MLANDGDFGMGDISWIADEARKLWADDPHTDISRFKDLLAQLPTAQFAVPKAVDLDLDPFSKEYAAEIEKLWREIYSAGGGNELGYDPSIHEQDAAYAACPIRFPGFFARRDDMAVRHAAYEYAMIADILLTSNVKSGMRVIEYGAGSGNIAITLSRLGVCVDTVDISRTYCDHIRLNAEFYGTSLTPHNEVFGFNPRPNTSKYDAVIFHACFHHSLNHAELVSRLYSMLDDNGVVLLSNEPISPDYYCPWGLRRDPESISVIAARGWMELGFDLTYLTKLFYFNGLLLRQEPNNFSTISLFTARKVSKVCGFGSSSFFSKMLVNAHEAESNGVWTTSRTELPLTTVFGSKNVALDVVNNFPINKRVAVSTKLGRSDYVVGPNAAMKINIPIEASAPISDSSVVIESQTDLPVDYFAGSKDRRELGVFLIGLTYN